jgi:hypothetical protein
MYIDYFIMTAYAFLCYLFYVMLIICNGVLFILYEFYKCLLIDRDYQIKKIHESTIILSRAVKFRKSKKVRYHTIL